MQDKDREFDLLVRSMMENAEEEVPSRVWSAVSSRLDAVSARKRPALIWMRRAIVGLAAAAAIAIVVIFGVTNSPKPVELTAQVQECTSADSEENIFSTKPTVVENKSTMSEAPAVIVEEPQFGTSGFLAGTEIAAKEEPEEVVAILPQQVERDEESSKVSTEREEAVAAKKEKKAEEEVSWTDPFETLEQEKTRKRDNRIAMTVGGNVSTNGNAAALSGRRVMMSSGNYASANYEQVTRVSNSATYSVPISFGVGARMYVTQRFSVGLGLNYYILGSTFTGSYQKRVDGVELYNLTSDIHSTVHYLGIPLSFNYDFVQNSKASVYFYAGGTLEKGLTNRYRIENSPEDIIYRESVDGVQYSLFGGVGVEFRLNDLMGIYVDPSLHWYPHCGQPFSIRTQQPLMFDLSLGLRFDF